MAWAVAHLAGASTRAAAAGALAVGALGGLGGVTWNRIRSRVRRVDVRIAGLKFLRSRSWTISPCCIRTITKNHEEFGQPVFARAVPVRSLFEFVTLKESTVGFSVASNRSERAMELYCIGSGLISILKNANVRKRGCGGVKRIYLKRLPLTDLLGWGWTPSS